MLLSKAWDLYESDKRIEGFSPQTLNAYRLQSILLIQYFDDVKIESITTTHLKEYLAKSSENLKPTSGSSYSLYEITFSLVTPRRSYSKKSACKD